MADVLPQDSEDAVRQAQADFQAAASSSLSEARDARAAVRSAQDQRVIEQRLGADVTPDYTRFVAKKRDGEVERYGTYRKVVLQRDNGGFKKTYFGLYNRSAGKRGYENEPYAERVEYYDSQGRLLKKELFKDYDVGKYGREKTYKHREERYENGQLVYEYQLDRESKGGRWKRTKEIDYKTGEVVKKKNDPPRSDRQSEEVELYEVRTPEGRVYRTSSAEWVQERFGIDVATADRGTFQLIEKDTGKRFESRVQEVNGKKLVLGVRSVPEGERLQDRIKLSKTSAVVSTPSPTKPRVLQEQQIPVQAPPEAALAATLTNLRDGNVSVVPPGTPTSQFNIPAELLPPPPKGELREIPRVPFLAAPKGYEAEESFRVSIPLPGQKGVEGKEIVTPIVFTTERADELVAQGRSDLAKGIRALKEGQVIEGARLTVTGGAEQFAGGVRRFFRGAREDPALTTATLGAYAGSSLIGPAGPALLFGAQNVFEMKTGQEPSALRIARDPISSAGEIAPAAVAFGVAETGIRGVRARSSAATDTARFQNQLMTRDAQRALAIDQRGVSTEIRVSPLEELQLRSTSVDQFGNRYYAGQSRPVYGEDLFLTSQELARAPTDFVFTADVATQSKVRPAGRAGAPDVVNVEPGFTPGPEPWVTDLATPRNVYYDFLKGERAVSAAEKTVATGEQFRGLTTAEQIAARSEPLTEVGVRPSDLDPGLVARTDARGRITFEPIELASTSDLAVRNVASGGKSGAQAQRIGPGGSTLEFKPSLDYFQEQFRVQQGGKELVLRESFATGKVEASVTPLVIRSITRTADPGLSVQPPRVKVETPKPEGSQSGTIKIREVEVDKPQSDGTVLKQKQKIIEIIEPELKAETKTVSKSEQKSAQEQKAKEKAKEKLKPSERYGVLQVQKLSGDTALNVRVKQIRKPTVKNKTSQKLSVAAAVTQLQGGALSSGQAVSQKPAQDQALRQAQDVGTSQLQIQSLETLPDSVLRPRQITELVPRVRTPSRPRPRTPGPKIEMPKIAKPFKFKIPEEDKKGREMFKAQVKKKGRFRTVDLAASAAEAFEKAKKIAKGSAAASVRVRDPKGKLVKPGPGIFGLLFRKSKKDPFTLVEKDKFRIDTPGERLEISAKGIKTPKKKKRRGGFFGLG